MKLVEIPPQVAANEVDEEILEIFIDEVSEVSDEIVSSFTAWSTDVEDAEALKTLRRCFHTLKGSGRLVGATVIGELGWRFENMLNRVIDGTISPSENLFKLVKQVKNVLPNLVEQFRLQQPTDYPSLLLISQADCFTQTKGQSIGEFEAADAAVATAPTKSDNAKTVEALETIADEPDEDTLVDETFEEELLAKSDAAVELAKTVQEEAVEIPVESEDSDFKSDFESDSEEELAMDIEASVDDSSDEHFELMNLTDSELSELVGEEELVFDEASLALTEDEGLLEEGIAEEVEIEVVDPVLFEIFRRESGQHIANLKNIFSVYEQNPQNPTGHVEYDIMRAFHTLNGSSRSVQLTAVSALAAPVENFARELVDRKLTLNPERLSLFQEATHVLEILLNGEFIAPERQQTLLAHVQSLLEALPPPAKAEATPTPAVTLPAADVVLPDAADEFMSIFLEEADELLENTQSLLERWQGAPNNLQIVKELQRELHTLKGGSRMVGIVPMGDLSHHLESILEQVANGLAQSSPKLQEIVQNSVDELAAMLEAVRSGVPLEMPNDLIGQISSVLVPTSGDDSTGTKTTPATSVAPAPAPEAVKPAARPVQNFTEESAEEGNRAERGSEKETDLIEGGEDRIRVKVALVDKITNLSGELSISRAHIEQQQSAIKVNLGEMGQTIIRLRDQLRRSYIETEAQIISNFASRNVRNADEEFDPLELDRFSLLQQLSRSLMESVSDLVNIEDAMKNLTRHTDILLIQQSRLSGELQDCIMRTRMVPFSRISPRLQRIARLTARELHKQVEFTINGENIEFERSVLNRMVAPLEHMLRNAIGHGVEDAATRQQSGKPALAHVMIDLSKEGTDLVIRLSDDGAGLDLVAIRRKAEERGLLKPGTVVSDRDLAQFILEPSFSTAKTITQVSGRGVGMDVANSEIKQLGGTLEIHSHPGKGTTFEITLPLSLTVNLALMVHVGEETLAIPLSHVEAVMRASRQEVLPSDAEDVRYYKYMENNYRVFHLGELLGFGRASTDSPLIPMLLVRAQERRIALLVDGIEGSKEIVVKSVGQQISAIRWITGATILGDGRVVLILDISNLTRLDTSGQSEEAQKIASADFEEKPPAKTIMVVDDSITVRKVTARLLKRQGMEVMTAKDGVDAVAQLQEHIPDLMLLDVEMPRMDGYELATQIRNTPEWKHLPIIMITSRTGTKHRDRAEKIGINRYLGKPFNENDLLKDINALLAESSGRTSNYPVEPLA